MSLEPQELKQMVRIIRGIEALETPHDTSNETILNILRRFDVGEAELNSVKLALAAVDGKRILDCELPCRNKLGKSLVYRNAMKAGSTLAADDISAKVSEPFGVSADKIDDFIGSTLNTDVSVDQNVAPSHFDTRTTWPYRNQLPRKTHDIFLDEFFIYSDLAVAKPFPQFSFST